MQREYAARVESALLAFGFDVYTMPPIREVVTRKKAIERSSGEVRSESPGESVNESGATQLDVERVEHYLERQGIQANHVVESLAHAYDIGAAAQFTQAWVRVYELKSKRLVASFSVVPYKEPRFIYDAFSAAGFPVERVEAD